MFLKVAPSLESWKNSFVVILHDWFCKGVCPRGERARQTREERWNDGPCGVTGRGRGTFLREQREGRKRTCEQDGKA